MTELAPANRPSPHLLAALLPWEKETDFIALLDQWRDTYKPQGPAEAGLVEQLAWTDWRRRRLVIGERAMHMMQAQSRTGDKTQYGRSDALVHRALLDQPSRLRKHASREAMSTSVTDDAEQIDFSREALVRLKTALEMARSDDPDAHGKALGYLEVESVEWWDEERDDDAGLFPTGAEGLCSFLEGKVRPFLQEMLLDAQERPAVRLQAQGESVDLGRMNILLGLDERLGRQFEKAMTMLIRLQERRETKR